MVYRAQSKKETARDAHEVKLTNINEGPDEKLLIVISEGTSQKVMIHIKNPAGPLHRISKSPRRAPCLLIVLYAYAHALSHSYYSNS